MVKCLDRQVWRIIGLQHGKQKWRGCGTRVHLLLHTDKHGPVSPKVSILLHATHTLLKSISEYIVMLLPPPYILKLYKGYLHEKNWVYISHYIK